MSWNTFNHSITQHLHPLLHQQHRCHMHVRCTLQQCELLTCC
jgi:hypothetical protein